MTSRDVGSQFALRAQTLGSLTSQAPVYFRDIAVGEVLGHKLADDDQGGVIIDIFIHAPHHLRIRDTSRFWKASGIEISADSDGFDFRMESITSLIAGGIAFDTPVTAGGAKAPSKAGTVFKLFERFRDIGESKYVRKVPYLLYFDGSVRGLSIGAPVEFMGIKVGSVTDIAVDINPKTLDIKIPVVIEMEPERIASTKVIESREKYSGLKTLVKRGLRAQLQTGSLLTGKLFVQLEFYPDFPPVKLKMTGKYPEIPTFPSTMDQFRRTVTDVLAEINRLPLDKIANEVLETVEGTNRLINSPEILESVRNLNKTLDDFQKLTGDVDEKVISLTASTEKTLVAARAALKVADPNSPAVVNLSNALKELSAAARSIRALADYLERHPEALVHGKGAPGGQ